MGAILTGGVIISYVMALWLYIDFGLLWENHKNDEEQYDAVKDRQVHSRLDPQEWFQLDGEIGKIRQRLLFFS